jgi:uncharacterized protein YkwD
MPRGLGGSLWKTVLIGIGLVPAVCLGTFFGLVLAAEAMGMGDLSRLETAAHDVLAYTGLVSLPTATAPATMTFDFGPYPAIPPTETALPTQAPSPTPMPSLTASPSATPTASETPTETPVPTGTATLTSSPSPTSSPTTGCYATAWRTRTPTRTPTRTATRTATPSSSPAPTGSPGVPPTTAAPTATSEVPPTSALPTDTSEVPPTLGVPTLTSEVPPTIALPTFTSTTPPTVAAPTATSSACDAAANSGVEGQVITLVNDKRTSQGLAAYSVDSRLTAAARVQATDMACNHFTSHTGSDGSSVRDRVVRQGYSWSWIGENYFVGSGSAQTAFNWWMNSAPHTANILSPNYTQFGVGYVYDADSDYGGYFVIVFAKPG